MSLVGMSRLSKKHDLAVWTAFFPLPTTGTTSMNPWQVLAMSVFRRAASEAYTVGTSGRIVPLQQ